MTWKWIDDLKKFLVVKLFAIYLRYLIGFAFVFASIIKIRGERFTSISPTEPVGYFFEAMYQSGFYWQFLGWAQLVSGALLMSQRFSTIGAMVFFPVILNVCLITHSVDFGSGTPTITTLMLLGTVFLLLWDYRKWVHLFLPDHHVKIDLTQQPRDAFMTDPVWTVTGVWFVVVTVTMNVIGKSMAGMHVGLGILFLSGVFAFVWGMVRHQRRLKFSKA
ncbi:MAG: hypothetical protein ACOYXA_12200 [Bacteroidota bacterium]